MAHHTPLVRPEARPEPLPLKRLPRNIQKKVELEIPQGNEQNVCWLWTGTSQPPKRRLHWNKGMGGENPAYRGDAAPAVYVNDRAVPKVHSPELGYSVPAYRHVFAATYRMSIRDVPRLRRCCNDLCVSPHHCLPVEAIPSRRAPVEPVPAPPAPVEPASPPKPPVADVEAILAKLRAKEVSHHLGATYAAEEIGIDPVLLTGDIWKVYWHECDKAENALDDGDEDD